MRLEVCVQQYVETEELEAIGSWCIIQKLFGTCLKVMLNRNYRFYYRIVYSFPDNLHIYACLLKMCLQGTQGPFVAVVSLQDRFILGEIVWLLIDAVVGEVLVQILLSIRSARVVWLGRKPCQAFIVNVYSKWINTCHEHVDSEVELVAVDKQRVRNVLANDSPIVFQVKFIQIIYKVDSFSLRALGWLHNP